MTISTIEISGNAAIVHMPMRSGDARRNDPTASPGNEQQNEAHSVELLHSRVDNGKDGCVMAWGAGKYRSTHNGHKPEKRRGASRDNGPRGSALNRLERFLRGGQGGLCPVER